MTFSIVIMVGRGYFLPTHVHEASDEYKIYPDKNPNLNEEQKKIAQETESLIKEVLGEKINNEDREYESKLIFDAINEIRDEL